MSNKDSSYKNNDDLTIKKAIIKCIYINFLMAIVSFIFFPFTNSVSILFDGFYSFFIGITIIIGYIIKFKSKTDHERYPFGKRIFENMFVMFKLLIIIIMSIVFFIMAITEIVNAIYNPSLIKPSPEFWKYIIYTIIMIFLCFLCWLIYHLANKKVNGSMLLETEKKISILDLGISLSIGVALTISALSLMNNPNENLIRLIIDRSFLLFVILLSTPSLIKQFNKSVKIIAGKRLLKDFENEIKILINRERDLASDIFLKSTGSSYEIYIRINNSDKFEISEEIKLENYQKIKEFLKSDVFIYYFIY